VSEWEGDEKPAKQKAREMIELTQAINRTSFAGRQIVTCQTCHDGRVVPADTPRVDDAGWMKKPPAPVPPFPDAADVLAAYVRGAGGEASLAAIKVRHVTGTVTRFNGRSEPVSGPFDLLQQGTSATLKTELSHPPEADAEVNASLVRPLVTARNYTDLKVVGFDRIRDRDVIVVSGRNSRGNEHRLFFDRQTGLLLRRTDEILTPLGALPERYDLGDYRAVDGVMVPHLFEWARADYQITFRFDTVRHNAAVSER